MAPEGHVHSFGDITMHHIKLLFVQATQTICAIFFPPHAFMKIISGLIRLKKTSAPGQSYAFIFGLILTLTWFSTGCNKSKPPAIQAALDENTNQAAPGQAPVYQQPAASP